ncbi:MAG: DUF4856 domain-containing protein [Myxococcota bacterium]
MNAKGWAFLSMCGILGAPLACGDDGGASTSEPAELSVPDTFTFESRFELGASSVRYTGQTFRHTLIVELDRYVRSLTADIDGGFVPASGDIEDALAFYLEFDPTEGADVPLTFPEATLQQTFGDLESSATLLEKIAGQDPEGQHEDWTTGFIGWGETGATTPLQLVRDWFTELDALAVARANLDVVQRPNGGPVDSVFVTADGRDLAQLLQKFLTGAIAYSQGADDYLDNDTEGKGLLSPNEQSGDAPYSVLEHQWDEGFGYFGASRSYLLQTDEERTGSEQIDSNGDGAIDLSSEFNFGHSTNAAKRDLGANVPTDFTDDAMTALLEGRAILAASNGELSEDEMSRLLDARDRVLSAWENAIASTVVHYINDVLADMNRFGTDDYDFEDHAKHWSEMKGFALTLQFSRFAAVTDVELETIHEIMGTAPVLPTADDSTVEAYRQGLLDARQIIGDAYGFAEANLGDENGEGGW